MVMIIQIVIMVAYEYIAFIDIGRRKAMNDEQAISTLEHEIALIS
jgi:hypothetical protein